MSNVLAPNGVLTSVHYRGADGIWRPILVTAFEEPQAMQAEVVEQQVRDVVIGALPTKQPLSTGSMTFMDIQPTPNGFTFREAVLGLGLATGTAFVSTAGTITRTYPGDNRLVDLRITKDLSRIQGHSFYRIITGVEARFGASPAEADSGNTQQTALTVYGSVGDPVYV